MAMMFSNLDDARRLWRMGVRSAVAGCFGLALLGHDGLGDPLAAGEGAPKPPAAPPAVVAEKQAEAPPAVVPAEAEGRSRITADQAEVDMKSGVATFTGNVLVTDSAMTLNCDQMVVVFSAEQQVKRVEAKGHVLIVEAGKERKAEAETAIYDLEKRTITLAGNPRLEMADRRLYNAETITYDLDSEKVVTTGRRTVFEAKAGGGEFSLDIFGAAAGGAAQPSKDKPKDKPDGQ